MLHQRSIHQLKLLQALQKKRMNESRKHADEEYKPVIAKSTSEQEAVQAEQVRDKSSPFQVITPTETIMDPPKKSFPTEMFQQKSIPIKIEQSETRKLFEEYEQFKYEQNLWNKLHGK